MIAWSSGTMHPIGVGRAAPHPSALSWDSHGALAFVIRISRGQGETGAENSKADNRRRTELAV